MIQVNELRIGNWVMVGKMTEPTRVFSLNYNRNSDYIGYLINASIPGSHLYPIPLTPEILEKCGFKYDHDQIGMMYRIKNFVMFYDGEGIGRNYGMDASDEERMDVNCKYLHQLQNLYFALTNTEINYTP